MSTTDRTKLPCSPTIQLLKDPSIKHGDQIIYWDGAHLLHGQVTCCKRTTKCHVTTPTMLIVTFNVLGVATGAEHYEEDTCVAYDDLMGEAPILCNFDLALFQKLATWVRSRGILPNVVVNMQVEREIVEWRGVMEA